MEPLCVSCELYKDGVKTCFPAGSPNRVSNSGYCHNLQAYQVVQGEELAKRRNKFNEDIKRVFEPHLAPKTA